MALPGGEFIVFYLFFTSYHASHHLLVLCFANKPILFSGLGRGRKGFTLLCNPLLPGVAPARSNDLINTGCRCRLARL